LSLPLGSFSSPLKRVKVTEWLRAEPGRTGVDLFHSLEQLYPGRLRPVQVRTLQRGLQPIRARLLVVFENNWNEDTSSPLMSLPELRGELLTEIS